MNPHAWVELTASSPYGLARLVHLLAVSLSAALFAARGLGVLAHAAWPMQARWRWLSVAIDGVLLLAGISLWWLVPHNPLHEPWLAAKLLLLPVYVVLGSLALKRARTAWGRRLCLAAALVCVATLASIARTRQPWGWLSWLG